MKEDCVSGELGIRSVLVSGGPELWPGAAPGVLCPSLAGLQVHRLGTAATPCWTHTAWRQGGSGRQQVMPSFYTKTKVTPPRDWERATAFPNLPFQSARHSSGPECWFAGLCVCVCGGGSHQTGSKVFICYPLGF